MGEGGQSSEVIMRGLSHNSFRRIRSTRTAQTQAPVYTPPTEKVTCECGDAEPGKCGACNVKEVA